jgi:spermidine synthase
MVVRNRVGLVLAAAFLLTSLASAQTRTLYEKQSPFNNVIVTEDERGFRALVFNRNGVRQSVVKLGDPDHLELAYAKVVPIGLAFVESPRRMLVVGLGGGTIPSFLHKHYPRARIDVVDIDPVVVDVARRFFGFREDENLQAHVDDGRKFIERCRDPYDIIFLDAFGADSIPYDLATREFLLAVRKALTPEGLVVGNVWSSYSNPLYESMIRTYEDVFASLYVVDVQGAGNRILLAFPRRVEVSKEELIEKARRISAAKGFRFDLGESVRYGFRKPGDEESGGKVLLDRDKPPSSD